jgi:hypothetical protein
LVLLKRRPVDGDNSARRARLDCNIGPRKPAKERSTPGKWRPSIKEYIGWLPDGDPFEYQEGLPEDVWQGTFTKPLRGEEAGQ